jgi:hypothetical protein
MDRLNSHFLRPPTTRSRAVCGKGQRALVDKLGVSCSRSRLPGPYRYYPGIVQQAQGRSAETAVSPQHNNQFTVYNLQLFESFFRPTASTLREFYCGQFTRRSMKRNGRSSLNCIHRKKQRSKKEIKKIEKGKESKRKRDMNFVILDRK